MKKSITILFFFTFCIIQKLTSQTSDTPQSKITHFALSASRVYGFVFAHDKQVNNTAGTIVTGVEVKLNRIRTDAEAKRYAGKYFNSGFTLAYYQFSKGFLGNAVYTSYFLEPYLINNKKYMLGVVAKVGLSYNSNPYNEILNNQNFSYSLYVNPYLCLGFNSSIKASKKFRIELSAMFNHNSNGSFYHPNYGINFPTGSLGIVYDLSTTKLKHIVPTKKFTWRFDIMPFATYKSIPLDRNHFYWLYGLAAQVNREIGFFHTVNFALEWLMDFGFKKTLQINGRSTLDYHRAGALLGHEFIFKKLNFSQQLGIYLYNQNPYIDRIYHRWGLYFHLNKNWMAGINLSAHRQIADFLDFRIIYSSYR